MTSVRINNKFIQFLLHLFLITIFLSSFVLCQNTFNLTNYESADVSSRPSYLTSSFNYQTANATSYIRLPVTSTYAVRSNDQLIWSVKWTSSGSSNTSDLNQGISLDLCESVDKCTGNSSIASAPDQNQLFASPTTNLLASISSIQSQFYTRLITLPQAGSSITYFGIVCDQSNGPAGRFEASFEKIYIVNQQCQIQLAIYDVYGQFANQTSIGQIENDCVQIKNRLSNGVGLTDSTSANDNGNNTTNTTTSDQLNNSTNDTNISTSNQTSSTGKDASLSHVSTSGLEQSSSSSARVSSTSTSSLNHVRYSSTGSDLVGSNLTNSNASSTAVAAANFNTESSSGIMTRATGENQNSRAASHFTSKHFFLTACLTLISFNYVNFVAA